MAEFAKRAIGYGVVCALLGWWLFDSWLAGAAIGVGLAVLELVVFGVLSRRR